MEVSRLNSQRPLRHEMQLPDVAVHPTHKILPETMSAGRGLRRREFLAGLAATSVVSAWIPRSAAGQGASAPLSPGRDPIRFAITVRPASKRARALARVLRADLQSGGPFEYQPLQTDAPVGAASVATHFETLRARAVHVLITIELKERAGSYTLDYELWDASAGSRVGTSRLTTDGRYWRRLAHQLADATYAHFTGKLGGFDSLLAYVSERYVAGGSKRLAVSDHDGAGRRVLTDADTWVFSPCFNARATRIAFGTLVDDSPTISYMDLRTRIRHRLPTPGPAFAPRFSPVNDEVLYAFQDGKSTHLATTDMHSGTIRVLTRGPYIDTDGAISPDGARLAFVSNRSGEPALFIMRLSDHVIQPIATTGARALTAPDWSPDGQRIAFSWRRGDFLSLALLETQTGKLTEPNLRHGREAQVSRAVWSPNGLRLAYCQEDNSGPKIMIARADGAVAKSLPTAGHASDPTWSGNLPD